MIKHQAFFEFLAATDQASSAWSPVVAGLAALRLTDARLEKEAQVEQDWASVESVRSAVGAVNEGDPIRSILMSLTEAASQRELQRDVIGQRLLSYGRALNFEGKWILACDVFETADNVAGVPLNPQITIDANIALGSAARRLAAWDRSAEAYARAAHIANAVGNSAAALSVDVRRAMTHVIRGNLPAAEALISETLQHARSSHFSDVIGLALHARSSIAHHRGEYADAIHFAYEALEEMGDSVERDAVLSDIAAAFGGMRMNDAARDGYLIVSATSQSQWLRWQATINLMELASIDGNAQEFDRYADELRSAALDPRLRTWYYLLLGQGQQRFNRTAEAETSLASAISIAEQNELHQIAHEARVAMTSLKSNEKARREVVNAPADIDPSLRWIVSELSSMRESALANP